MQYNIRMNSPYIPHLPSNNTASENTVPAYQAVKETPTDVNNKSSNAVLKLLSTLLAVLILCTLGLYLYNKNTENTIINALTLNKIDVLERYTTLKNEYDNPDIVRTKTQNMLDKELSKGINLLTKIEDKRIMHGVLDAPKLLADYINTTSYSELDNVGTITIQYKNDILQVDINASHPLGKVFMLVSYYNDMLSGLPFLDTGDLNTLKRNSDDDANDSTDVRLEYRIIAPKPLLEDLYPYEQWLLNTQ